MKKANKNYEQMTEHELLVEILKSQRTDARHERISAYANILLAVILAVAMVILIPRLVYTLEQTNQAIAEVQDIADTAKNTLESVEEMSGQVSTMMEDNMEGVAQALENVNKVDFDTLNQSVQALHDVVEPMANFMNQFR